MKKNELDLKKYYLVIYRGNRFLAHIDPTKWPRKGVKIPLIIDKAEKPFSGPLAAPMPCFYDAAPEAERYQYFSEWIKSSPTPKDTSDAVKKYQKKKKRAENKAAPEQKSAPQAAAAPEQQTGHGGIEFLIYSATSQLRAYADLLGYVMRDAVRDKKGIDLGNLVDHIQTIQIAFNNMNKK